MATIGTASAIVVTGLLTAVIGTGVAWAGGPGEAARQDAIARAAANSTPLGPGAFVVVSACP